PLGARHGHPNWRKALQSTGIESEKTAQVINKISDSYVSWQENSFPGLLGNVIAGRICNRLDFGGTNCAVDAACASSLSAVHLAVLELLSGRSDMVITGGVDMLNDIFMQMCFSKTGVLSPTGDIRPFSKDADGTVLGEGVGLFVLKRLEDARRDGNKIYAVIKGMGSSSDGKSQSIYAPRAKGQLKALQTAYKDAGIDPATVGLFEAHGTGTKVGDAVEFQALNRLLENADKNKNSCALGSVKSMIGHTKAAAGAAGLMKIVLALHHKVLPPTLKIDQPDPNLKIHESPLYLNTETRPWFSSKDHPRRSGVSAFGFGGSNFHLVLEEYRPDKEVVSWDGAVEIAALSAPDAQGLVEHLNSLKAVITSGASFQEISIKAAQTRSDFSSTDPCRLLVVLERSMDLARLFDRVKHALELNGTTSSWHAKNIYYGCSDKSGKLAFVFPGQGSQYVGMGRDLVCNFPEAFKILENVNKKFESSSYVTDFIYPPPALTPRENKKQQERLRATDIAQPAIGAVSIAMQQVLQGFGVQPDATCGHSFGEFSALCAAGWIDLDTFLHLAITRGRLMATAGQTNGAMLAVKAPLNELADMINKSDLDVVLANRNSPQQGVLSGSIEEISRAEKICKQQGFKSILLPVSAAFHSPLIKDAQKPFHQTLKAIDIKPSDVPVFSNTTGTPYSHDTEEVKKLLGEHLLCPVDFVSEIENLYASGVSTYIEVGPKSVLTGLVKAILKDRDFEALALDDSAGRRFGLTDLAATLSLIASLGHRVDLSKWQEAHTQTRKQLMSIPIAGVNYRPPTPLKPQSNRPAASADQKRSDHSQSMHSSDYSSSTTLIDKQRPLETGRDASPVSKINPNIDPQQLNLNMPSTSISGNKNTMKNTQQQEKFILDALKVVQEGLKSMQALQAQTAETHQMFLQTQSEAGRTLQNMMDNTQRLAEASLGLKTTVDPSSFKSERSFKQFEPEEQIAQTQATHKTPYDQALQPGLPESETASTLIREPDLTIDKKTPLPSGSSQKELGNSMLEVVSQLTGYPVEMLDLNMDIEADLGIDSIKRVEILSTLEEKVPGLPPVSPEVMGSLKTLGQIIAYLADVDADKTDAAQNETATDYHALSKPDTVESTAPAGSTSKDLLDVSPKNLAAGIERKVVAVVEKPFNPGDRLALPPGRKVFVTDDKTGLA
ncbi:MAG: acyltransferase domain-containing protein, partial [Desulfobacteraceae bacterium]|nr:acyltransferase domain-containing protein [Desulfobacteraceae bacterium]